MPGFGLLYVAALLIVSGGAARISPDFHHLIENLFIYERYFPYPEDAAAWVKTKTEILTWYEGVIKLEHEFGDIIGYDATDEEMDDFIAKVEAQKKTIQNGVFTAFQLSKGPVNTFRSSLIDLLTQYQEDIRQTLKELDERFAQLRVVIMEPWDYELGNGHSDQCSTLKAKMDEQLTAALRPLETDYILGVKSVRFEKRDNLTLAVIEIRVKTAADLASVPETIDSAVVLDWDISKIGNIEIDEETLVLEDVPPSEFLVNIHTVVDYKPGFADTSSKAHREFEDEIMKQINFLLSNPYYGRDDTFAFAKMTDITLGRDNKADVEIIVNCRNKYDQNKRDIYSNLLHGISKDGMGTAYMGSTMIRDVIKVLDEEEIEMLREKQKLFKEEKEAELQESEKEDQMRANNFLFITIPFVTGVLILVFTFMMCVNFRHCCCNLCAPTMDHKVTYKIPSTE